MAIAAPSQRMLLVAHIVNLALFFIWMPMVWDHMCWAAVLELTFVVFSLSGSDRTFLPAARTQMCCLYIVAAFWKLTTSFLDFRTSCGSLLFAELASTLVPETMLPVGGATAEALLRAAPTLSALLEFAIGPVLAVMPRMGIILSIGFHITINLLPLNCAHTSHLPKRMHA